MRQSDRNPRVEELLQRPWTIVTGTKADGARWARCREIEHAVAYAGPSENLDELFWDSLRASLEAMLESGEPIPAPPSPISFDTVHAVAMERIEFEAAAVGFATRPAPTAVSATAALPARATGAVAGV